MHNMLGNWDVDDDPAVSDAGERASRMLFSSADQRDGSNSRGISVHRQAAEEGNGGHINLRGSAVDLGTISAADANERDPAGMHDNTIDMPNGMGNTVHRTTAKTHDSLVIEQAPRKRYAFHLVGERPSRARPRRRTPLQKVACHSRCSRGLRRGPMRSGF